MNKCDMCMIVGLAGQAVYNDELKSVSKLLSDAEKAAHKVFEQLPE